MMEIFSALYLNYENHLQVEWKKGKDWFVILVIFANMMKVLYLWKNMEMVPSGTVF